MQKWKGFAFGLAGVGLACAGWLTTDVLEANNDFCNACHLPSGVALHDQIRTGFDAKPAQSLAALHGSSARNLAWGPREFRCIDCHGGVGWLGRAKVKALAAKDAMVWLGGDFDEPDHMEYPLGEADCRQCHQGFEAGSETDANEQSFDAEAMRFHALAVHNADLGVDCVECHSVHEGGDDEELFYLDATRVRERCGRCHSEFGRE